MRNIDRYFRVLVLIVALWFVPFAYASAQSVAQLLDKSAQAAQSVSYKGTFMYSRGAQIETMRVYHRIESDGFQELIQSLNGDASEIVRNEKGVWCYFPETQEGFYKSRDDGSYRMPAISSVSLANLEKYYTITNKGRNRVAMRSAHRLEFEPKDAFRYGLTLWIDEESGLLLRSDLLDENMAIIDSYRFVEIAINEQITEAELTPHSPGTDYLWNFSAAGTAPSADELTPITVSSVPDGFKMIKHVRGQFDEAEKEQIVYSDELATVSLFMQKLMQDETDGLFVGDSKLGSVNAYGRVIEGYQVTVVGEVPIETVRTIGNSVVVAKN